MKYVFYLVKTIKHDKGKKICQAILNFGINANYNWVTYIRTLFNRHCFGFISEDPRVTYKTLLIQIYIYRLLDQYKQNWYGYDKRTQLEC